MIFEINFKGLNNMETVTNQDVELANEFVRHTNRNIFLMGKAGTGKTTFLRDLKHSSPKRMVVVAPTGVAAINAGGVTIHSFFQLPFHPFIPSFYLPGNSHDFQTRGNDQAGYKMSREKAKKQVRGEALRQELEADGIRVRAGSMAGLAEEAPQAYKDVDEVVETVCAAGLARKVARLVPVLVIKG